MTFGGFHKKKRRSKQKNFKKDTRPENLRPGGKDYVDPTTRPDYKAPAVAKHKVIGASNLEANLKAKAAKEARILAEKENGLKASAPVEDRPMLNCRDCTEAFDFSAQEQEVYTSKGWAVPSRCRSCREKKRADPTSKSFKPKERSTSTKEAKTKANSAPSAEPPAKRKKFDSGDGQAEGQTVEAKAGDKTEGAREDSDGSASDTSSDSESGPETLSLKTEEGTLPTTAKTSSNKVESKGAKSASDSSSDDDDDDDESNPEALVAKAFSRKTDQLEDDDDDDLPQAKEKGHAYENGDGDDDDEGWAEEEEEYGDSEGGWGGTPGEGYPWMDYRDAEACAKPLEAFDLLEALELPKEALTDEGKVRGGGNRLRSQYHRLGLRYHPDHFEPKRQGNATPVTAQRLAAALYFRRVAVAFVSLLDPDRAMIYSKHGWAGLKASESFAEISSLDTPPFARFDAFFEGTDPDDRQYLLLEASSGGHFSDEERPDKRCEVTEPEDNDSDEDSDSDSQDEEAYLALVARDAKEKAQLTKSSSSSSSSSSKKRMDVPFPHPPAGVGAPIVMAAASMPSPSQRLAMTAAAGDPFARVAAARKAADSSKSAQSTAK